MSTVQQKDSAVVTIHDVRLSYPYLFTPQEGKNQDGTPNGKRQYAAVFILSKVKNADDLNRLRAAASHVKQEKWQGKSVNLIGSCLRDGAEKEATDGYGRDVMFISARSDCKPGKPAPGIVDQQLRHLKAEDGKPYAGCYVNATVRAWAQDNTNGKRINWTLWNVQFVRDGEPFGEKRATPEETFQAIADTANVDAGGARDQI